MMMRRMELDLHYASFVELTPKRQAKVRKRVLSALKEFPDVCEGSIWLGGVEHYFTYKVRGELVTMHLLPRTDAEEILNQLVGLSTHEPFNPLPEAERPN
jgi:hypothetical protein